MTAETCYHTACYTNFLPEKKHKKLKTGTNKNQEMTRLFEKKIMLLENDKDIHLVQAFRRKLIEICEEEDEDKLYDTRYTKKLFKNRYEDFLWFSEDVGKNSLIYFKNVAENIIRENAKEAERYAQDSIDEAKNMIWKTASNLSLAEYRE